MSSNKGPTALGQAAPRGTDTLGFIPDSHHHWLLDDVVFWWDLIPPI
jgi:hypothetical protein